MQVLWAFTFTLFRKILTSVRMTLGTLVTTGNAQCETDCHSGLEPESPFVSVSNSGIHFSIVPEHSHFRQNDKVDIVCETHCHSGFNPESSSIVPEHSHLPKETNKGFVDDTFIF
jgi:hypothetical protein